MPSSVEYLQKVDTSGTWQVELLLLAWALRGWVQRGRRRGAGWQWWGRRGWRGGGGGGGIAAGIRLVGHRDVVLGRGEDEGSADDGTTRCCHAGDTKAQVAVTWFNPLLQSEKV